MSIVSEVVVLGGCVLDIISSAKPLIPATSNPGAVSIQAGGVGRNMSEALARLGIQTLLIAPIGDDAAAETLKQQCIAFQMDVSGLVRCTGKRTAVYSALMDAEGELMYGVVDSAIFDSYHFQELSAYYAKILKSKIVLLDANASIEFMQQASQFCSNHNIPVFFEGTSVQKSQKLGATGILPNITWLCPNLRELIAIYYSTLHSMMKSEKGHKTSESGGASSSLEDYLSSVLAKNDLSFYRQMIARLFDLGVRKWIIVKMGTKGALAAEKLSINEIRFTQYEIYPAKLVNVLGAGDNLVAGILFGMLRENLSVSESLPYGLLAAKMCVESPFAVPRDLSAEKLKSEFYSKKLQ